jgi:hypothetical protein
MASFEIADCPTELPLTEAPGSEGNVQTGTLTLTVRNQTERPRSARIGVELEGAAKPDWFAFEGATPTSPREIERDFTPKGTATIRVAIRVPAGEAPAKHVFHVRATAEDDPDNDVATGPNVAFEIAPWTAPPPPKPSGFPWWAIAVAAVLVLVVAAAVAYLIWFRGGPPPEVQGYVLRCQGGPTMQVLTGEDGSLHVNFVPTTQGTGSVPPQAGQCGWIDRGFGAGEPAVLVVVREVVGSSGLPRTIRAGEAFQVTAYNDGHGSMIVTKIGE